VFQSTICFSQKQGNIWCFGDSALIDWNDVNNPIFGRSVSKSRGSCSSISDSLGNLLFYFSNVSAIGDTCAAYGEFAFMYTKEHTIMENGQCLSGEGWYEEHSIIPMPDNDSLYYKFTADLYAYDGDTPGINYSIVDMHANGGLGKVIERDVSAVSYTAGGGSPVSWCIKAVRHGNGRDWWLIAKTTIFNLDLGEDLFYLLLLVTPEGVTVQQIPVVEPNCPTGFAFGSFSKDGTKYCSVCPNYPFGNIVTYDFDRCTGEFSNQKVIEETISIPSDSVNYDVYFSAEFSPNNRYLYIDNLDVECALGKRIFLFQYDLEDEFPALTRDTVMDYIETAQYSSRQGGLLKLAPDNKIYLARPLNSCYINMWPYPDSIYTEANTYLSVINNPDSAYPACNFTPYSFYLGGARTYHGLPNNPNFALGAVEGACDTSTSLNNSQKFLNTNLNIFPNPCYNNCQIQYKPAKSIGNITITNISGKVIYKEEYIPVTLLQYGYEINTSAFAKGVYFVRLVTDKVSVTKKMVKL
jgi:Secretion system C-terminal sorting domain